MWQSLEYTRRRRQGHSGRYASSVLLSLVLHGLVALALALYIVKTQVPEVWDATSALFVSIVEWEPVHVEPRPEPEPESDDEKPTEEPKPIEAPEPVRKLAKPTVTPSRLRGAGGAVSSRTAGIPRRRAPLSRLDAGDLEPGFGLPDGPAPERTAPRVDDDFSIETVAYVPSGEVIPVRLPQRELVGESPKIGRGRSFFDVGRGLGAGNAPGGRGYTTYGGNSTGSVGSGNSYYRGLMQRLAFGVLEGTTAEKIDVVFIIDSTASMVDNVRGVRAYVDDFIDLLIWKGRKPRFGLVTFGDARTKTPRVKGLTSKSGDLKNWLHRTEFTGGGDLAESTLDAVMAAITRIKFRKDAQKYFILLSDGPIHDRDYDGQSSYTLDEVLDVLEAKGVRLDAVGLDYLPIKQLAWGTGGRWLPIPGRGYLEQISMPLPVRGNAALGALLTQTEGPTDEVHFFLDPHRPAKYCELRWRVLNPRGRRIQGEFVERKEVEPGATRVTFRPRFDPEWFRGQPGAYTIIYRLTDSFGNTSTLRRIIEYR